MARLGPSGVALTIAPLPPAYPAAPCPQPSKDRRQANLARSRTPRRPPGLQRLANRFAGAHLDPQPAVFEVFAGLRRSARARRGPDEQRVTEHQSVLPLKVGNWVSSLAAISVKSATVACA